MALDLVDKRDVSVAESLSPQVQNAVRAVAAGAESERLEALVLAVMKRARASSLWLGCDCRNEDGRRPVVAPCRSHRGTDYWRALVGRQVAHAEGCVSPSAPAMPSPSTPRILCSRIGTGTERLRLASKRGECKSEATSAAYTLAAADQGKTLKVRVGFTDDGGNVSREATSARRAVPGESRRPSFRCDTRR